jgi:fructose-specific phosphotransferase system IIC component
MAAVVTGSKTVTQGAAPHLSAAKLTVLLANSIENSMVGDLLAILDACHRIPGGDTVGVTIGSILK